MITESKTIQAKKRKKNDIIYTQPDFAKKIVNHFSPHFLEGDFFLDPCRGKGAFYDALPENKDWCEIAEGKDFLEYNKPVDWIFANLPWSQPDFRKMARHGYSLAKNHIQLIRLHNAFGTHARHRDYYDLGHRIRELILIEDWKEVFIDKAPEGFQLCCFWTQRDYEGDCKITYWNKDNK